MSIPAPTTPGIRPFGLRRSFGPVSPLMWPSLAIALMWVAVLFIGLFGPDIDTSNGAGTNTSSVPSAVAIAFFAFLATWVVAHYAFRRPRPQDSSHTG